MDDVAPTRRDLETALIEKCWKNPDFREQVVSDPKGMLERQTGKALPEDLKIYVHEEDANTVHFSIPPAPSNITELSDEDLERVAGGTDVALVSILVTFGAAVATAAGATTMAAKAVTPKDEKLFGW